MNRHSRNNQLLLTSCGSPQVGHQLAHNFLITLQFIPQLNSYMISMLIFTMLADKPVTSYN